MGRYKIILKDGTTVEADDVRYAGEGHFVEYITRYSHKTCSVNSNDVKKVEKIDLGYEGGMRFTGEHDTSFRRTNGSI